MKEWMGRVEKEERYAGEGENRRRRGEGRVGRDERKGGKGGKDYYIGVYQIKWIGLRVKSTSIKNIPKRAARSKQPEMI